MSATSPALLGVGDGNFSLRQKLKSPKSMGAHFQVGIAHEMQHRGASELCCVRIFVDFTFGSVDFKPWMHDNLSLSLCRAIHGKLLPYLSCT